MRDVQLVSSRCYCWHEYLLSGKIVLAPDLVPINIYVRTLFRRFQLQLHIANAMYANLYLGKNE